MTSAKKEKAVLLSYEGCSTCKKALAWLKKKGIEAEVRPIVEEPPTRAELGKWVPASEKPLKKWLNTSGQSYRAIGKEAVDEMSDKEVVAALAADGKLVKRPVLVWGNGEEVLVGFDEAVWGDALL
jgi:arsenate reductase